MGKCRIRCEDTNQSEYHSDNESIFDSDIFWCTTRQVLANEISFAIWLCSLGLIRKGAHWQWHDHYICAYTYVFSILFSIGTRIKFDNKRITGCQCQMKREWKWIIEDPVLTLDEIHHLTWVTCLNVCVVVVPVFRFCWSVNWLKIINLVNLFWHMNFYKNWNATIAFVPLCKWFCWQHFSIKMTRGKMES